MISYSDCLLLLTNLQEQGIDCKEQLKKLSKENKIDLTVLKFINDNRELDLTRFYEKIRKSYNTKKSRLYINIMKEDIIEDPESILTTLNSYSLQILLFSKDIEDKVLFYKFARLDEVYHYSKTFDLIPCQKLLSIIKADIKALETVYR